MNKLRRLITKRACVRLTLLVVAGAIVNVAVAWGSIAYYSDEFSGFQLAATQDKWIVKCFDYPFTTALEIWPPSEEINVRPDMPDTGEFADVLPPWARQAFERARQLGEAKGYCVARGFPLMALQGYELLYERADDGDHPPRLDSVSAGLINIHGAVSIWRSVHQVRLPFGPVWPGFAINTVFYAAILWLLFSAPFALRRRLRVKHGLCPKCAYDLRGGGRAPKSDVCPECGWGAAGETATP